MKDYQAETIKAYDKYPELFNTKFEDHFNKHVIEKAELFVSKLKGSRVLDVGSGPGNHAAYFRDKGLEVTCLDISDKMLEFCKQKGLSTLKKDLEQIDLKKEFDGIWAYASLLHAPKKNMLRVLISLKEALKQGGIIGIAMKEGIGEGYEEDLRYPETKRWFSYYQPEELESLFEKTGFNVIRNGRTEGKHTTFMHYLLHL